MTTINGSIGQVSFLNDDKGPGAICIALVAVDFAAYTGSSDDATVTGLSTAIQNSRRDGKTVTLRNVTTATPGWDGTQDIYMNASGSFAATISGTGITGNLTTSAYGTEITTSVATKSPVLLAVTYSVA